MTYTLRTVATGTVPFERERPMVMLVAYWPLMTVAVLWLVNKSTMVKSKATCTCTGTLIGLIAFT